jgi:hypothetical protein
MSTENLKYGKYFWCIQTTENKDIMLMADQIEVSDGCLIASYTNDKGDKLNTFAMPTPQWKCFYSASMLDGTAVCIDTWK